MVAVHAVGDVETMKKVLINRRPRKGPWGGGVHFVNAFYERAKDNDVQIVESLSESPDVIFVFHPFSEDGTISFNDAAQYKIRNPSTKILLRVNECDARKGTDAVDSIWITMSHHVDHSIFVSEWMMSYFYQRGWACNSNEVIWNGIDRVRFVKNEKLNNGKTNIVCAHWSDNERKGQQVYEFLDDFVGRNSEYTFTFIGRTRAKLKNSTLKGPFSPEDLAKELTRYDVCINGSVYDPGPNAVIESIVAGLPTYVTIHGGGGVDFAGLDHTFETAEDIEKLLLSKQFVQNQDRFEDWSAVMKRIFERIKLL